MKQKNGKPGALIVGGSFTSLGAARNLAKHGIPVFVIDNEICIAQFSRHIEHFFKYPVFQDDLSFVQYLLRLAEEWDIKNWVLFPTTDNYVRVLAQQYDVLSSHYTVTTPAWDIVKYFYDKRLTDQLARQQHVLTPKTRCLAFLEDITSLDLEFPVVLKPATTTKFKAATKKKAFRANNIEETIEIFQMMSKIIDPNEIIIQEFVPGRGKNLYSFFGYFKNGLPVVGMTARRPRQHSLEFGTSTYVELINVPELRILSERLMCATKYTGMAEIEFMFNEKSFTYELIEVNPRIWGFHTIAIRAGVDLPYLAYADMLGEPIQLTPPRENVKWIRLTTDILTAAIEIWNGRLPVTEYLRTVWGSKDAVFSISDPLPFLMDILLVPYYAKRRGF